MTAQPTPSIDVPSQSSKQITCFTAWACRVPLLVAAALICAICGFNVVRLVGAHAPRDPWEAVEVLEAWRSMRGMQVYELTPNGHSTHVYGAIVPWLQGEIFRWVGRNNMSGRVLSLISALASVSLLAIAMRGQRSAWYLFVAWAAMLGVNHRSGQYFAENRPDMSCMLFATAGVLLLGIGQDRRRGLWVVLGTVCLVIGFFFKQTAFIFVLVPLLATVLSWRKPSVRQMFFALVPLAAALSVLVALRVLSPTVYYYMIDVPKAFSLDSGRRTLRILWDLLLDSPLFLVLIIECVVNDSRALRDDARVRWLCATLIIAIPYSAITAAKVGGWINSLLPALIPMAAFCILRLPRLLKRLDDATSPLAARMTLGVFLALVLLMTTFPHMSQENNLLVSQTPFDLEYDKAVSLAARLPGKIVCPEDPTIPLYATDYTGQSVFGERDTHLVNGRWPANIPQSVVAECRSANYIIDLPAYYDDPLQDGALRNLGFELAPEAALHLTSYRIWQRKGLESATHTVIAGTTPDTSK
jgi:hypothetical protein